MAKSKQISDRTAIPSLVAISSDATALRGSYLFSRLDYFPAESSKPTLRYTAVAHRHATPLDIIEFRAGYFTFGGGLWRYDRPISAVARLTMTLDPARRTLSYNPAYGVLPTRVGDLLPVGLHLSDLVALELILSGYYILNGYAYRTKDGTVICGVGASFAGKTTEVVREAARGAQVITEDIAVLDPTGEYVYPMTPFSSRWDYQGRAAKNRELVRFAPEPSVLAPVPVDEFQIIEFGKTRRVDPSEALRPDPTRWRAVNLIGNPFIRAILAQSGRWHEVLQHLAASGFGKQPGS